MKPITATMVRHTHWDREWYLPFEEFRAKLVRLIDSLLDELDGGEDCGPFMLDGQSVVLEDYLAIRPENAARLSAAVRCGKIEIGPWYILPDELLISGEAHIRNYLYGDKACAPFGAKNNIGYLPDSFGHPAQMPQIVRGLGMDAMIFWRGTANFMEKTEFYWESPAKGIRALCIHMPNGYGNSARLSREMGETTARLDAMIAELAERSTTDRVLLLNGSDHIVGQRDTARIVEQYNAATAKPYRIELSTMRRFLDALTPQLRDLATYGGEFCYGDRALLLGGTLSTRVYLKQRHCRAERAMERYLEPLGALTQKLRGRNGLKGYADSIWRALLKNAPHDSICGCSVDSVHRAMLARYDEIDIAQATQLQDLAASLCDPAPVGEDVRALVFEPTQDALPDCVELELDFDPMLIRRVNFAKSSIDEMEESIDHPAPPQGVRAFDETGRELPCAMLGMRKEYFMHLQDETLPETYKVNRAKVLVRMAGMSYGLHMLTFQKADHAVCAVSDSNSEIENERYHVRYVNGSFTVLDKKTGREHRNVCRLLDTGDAGDEYTYSWPKQDRLCVFEGGADISRTVVGGISKSLTVKGVWMLPASLSENRETRSAQEIACPVALTAKLVDGVDRIDFTLAFENNAADHRLQVEFPAGCRSEKSSSYATFALIERDIDVIVPPQWEEYPRMQHVLHGYASVSDGAYGATAIADGIYEYEPHNEADQSFLRLTLLRSVGWLSRADLLTRKGNGGWMLPTPEAQCIGLHTFRFALVYHDGDALASKAYAAADRFLCPAHVVPLFGQSAMQTDAFAFLSRLPSAVRLSALKAAENGKGILLRLVNIGAQTEVFVLRDTGFAAAYATNLAEARQHPLHNDGGFAVRIAPGEICSIELTDED